MKYILIIFTTLCLEYVRRKKKNEIKLPKKIFFPDSSLLSELNVNYNSWQSIQVKVAKIKERRR